MDGPGTSDCPTDSDHPPFDHHSEEFARDWRGIYDGMRAGCPVAHTPAHGGYYVISRYDDARQVLLDNKTFVCGRDLDLGSAGVVAGGVTIPTNPFRMGMMEMDAPQAQRYRKVILPWLSVRSVEEHRPRLGELVTWLLDRVTPKGSLDIVDDLANPLPAIVTLDLLGLPLDRWETYARVLHGAAYRQAGSARAVRGLLDELTETVIARRPQVTTPRCTLDALLVAEIDGRALSDAEVVELIFMLLNGGVDTSTAVIAHLLLRLDEHPDERALLVRQPELIPAYVDDLLRAVSPATGVARTAIRPVELSGVNLVPGDRVLVALGAANNDPDVFDHPEQIRTEPREPANLSFGTGAHRCVGSALAPAEIVALTAAVLERMPDYRIDRAQVQAYPTIPLVAGFIRMPATFTPTPRVGDVDPDGLPPWRDFAAAARLAGR